MRGQGRVYQPEKRRNGKCACRGKCKCAVEVSAAYMLDYTVNGVRYREAAGTDDYQEALTILTQRRAARENGAPVATEAPTLTLKAFVAEHIAKRRQSKKFTEGWIDVNEQHLNRAAEHFGAERKLASITVQDVAAWSVKLQDAGVKAGTVRPYLPPLPRPLKRGR